MVKYSNNLKSFFLNQGGFWGGRFLRRECILIIMSITPYLKFIGTIIRNLHKYPEHHLRKDEFSIKGHHILQEAIEEAFPYENVAIRYNRSTSEGPNNGRREISQGITRRLENSLYPHNFSPSQIAVLTTAVYTPIPSDIETSPAILVRNHNVYSETSDASIEEISLALEQLVDHGHIILRNGDYKAARKLDDLLD